jgi:hypothetical protein
MKKRSFIHILTIKINEIAKKGLTLHSENKMQSGEGINAFALAQN